MKLNMSKPIVAVLIPALIGVIGCSDNPMTSAGENAESGRLNQAGLRRTGNMQATAVTAKATKVVKVPAEA